MTRALAFLLASVIYPVADASERASYLSDMCAGCHGPDGVSSGLIPSLDGLESDYIASEMIAFRAGSREGTVMNLIAMGLSDADIQAIASSSSETETP